MKKYHKYKVSGIEWIGAVPEYWESWKLSHAFPKIGSGTTPESGNPIYYENGTINWLNTGDLNDGILDECAKKVTQKALEDYSSLKLFPAGSLVMAMYGATIGKTSIIKFDTTTNQACCVFCEADIIDIKFLHFWFQGHKEHIINLAIGGGQPNISQNILKDIRLYCPSIKEQTQIAAYLDYKINQIETLIANKQKLIELLQEERTAIINQAVTKGINPKAKLKPSGIDWLGEVPEHWEVKKLKYLCSLISEKVKDKPDYIIALENIESWTGKVSGQAEMKDMEGDVNMFKAGDILFSKLRPYLAKVVLTKQDGGCAGELLVLRTVEGVLPKFFFYRMISEAVITIIDGSTYGTKMPRASWDKFISQMKLPIPNIEEQGVIVNYIEFEHNRIDTIITKIEQEIELLKEYKTALISEVVTGKVDVRDEVVG